MEHTLESSKTLFFILVKMSFVASTKASSTLCPDLALASTKRRPSWRANSAPSCVVTWRGFNGARVRSQIQWPTRVDRKTHSLQSHKDQSCCRQGCMWDEDQHALVHPRAMTSHSRSLDVSDQCIIRLLCSGASMTYFSDLWHHRQGGNLLRRGNKNV